MDWLKGLTFLLKLEKVPRVWEVAQMSACFQGGGRGGGGFLSLLAFPAPRDTAAAARPPHRPRALQWGRRFPWLD